MSEFLYYVQWRFSLLSLCVLLGSTGAVPSAGFNSSNAVLAASLATTTSTASNASNCYKSWLDYQSSRDNYMTLHATSVVHDAAFSSERTSWASTQTDEIYTTLCDGEPRAHGTPSFYTNTTWETTAPNTTTIWPTFTMPPPSCSLNPSACSTLWEEYGASQRSLAQDEYLRSITVYNGSGIASPTPPTCSSPAGICGPCQIFGRNAHLAYWPVTTTQGPSNSTATTDCNAPGVTLASNVTALVTAVLSGVTLTSPTAYIFVDTIFSYDYCTTRTYPGTVLTMPPGALSSGRAQHGVIEASFNFADLAPGHVSRDAYTNMGECFNFPTWCNETIYEQWYHPFILMPRSVTGLRPEWAGCTAAHFGIFDPPVAVHGVNGFGPSSSSSGVVTSAAEVQTQNPSPTQGVSVPVATRTRDPVPVQSTVDPAAPVQSTVVDPGDPQSQTQVQPVPPSPTSVVGIATSTAIVLDPTDPSDPSNPFNPVDPTSTPIPNDPATPSPAPSSSTANIGELICLAFGGGSSCHNIGSTAAPIRTPSPAVVLTLGNTIITAADPPSATEVVLGSLTLKPGDPLATVSGHVVSIASSGGIVVDGSTVVASGVGGGVTTVVGGQTIVLSAAGPSTTVVDGSTVVLSAPGPLTSVIDGSTIVLPASRPLTTIIGGETVVFSVPGDLTTVVGGSTVVLPPSGPLTTIIEGQTVVFSAPGDLTTVVGGSTVVLRPSGPFTTVIDGSTVVLPPSGPLTTVIDGSTVVIPAPTPGSLTTVLDGSTLVLPATGTGRLYTVGTQIFTAIHTSGTIVLIPLTSASFSKSTNALSNSTTPATGNGASASITLPSGFLGSGTPEAPASTSSGLAVGRVGPGLGVVIEVVVVVVVGVWG